MKNNNSTQSSAPNAERTNVRGYIHGGEVEHDDLLHTNASIDNGEAFASSCRYTDWSAYFVEGEDEE